MSLDPTSFPRSNSPASSDSSFTRSRLRGKEEPLKKDKNYRRYASTVERALSLFDTALQEWADYISFLSRLLKALQSHPADLPVVPHKVLVAKRLSQCLNPSLPSGVHQKALEVYTYIFNLIKSEGLSHDLPLYLPGIAPTLTFASLTVRPLFLSLIENHICGLEPWAIRPALKAIILALLPGLEEETSDDFDHTLRLVNKFRDIAATKLETQRTGADAESSGQYFWQCLFLASITSPSRRSGVLAYLNRYLPKLGITDRRPSKGDGSNFEDMPHDMRVAVDSVIMPEPGLLIRCFASGLVDEQILVQRNFLDLLVTHLPLSSPILQSRITDDDLQRLMIAAVGVVARRDMSLNRRLWAWFLGPEAASDQPSFEGEGTTGSYAVDDEQLSQSEYFSQFGLKALVKSLLRLNEQDARTPSERAKPFRISLSLMDRWEVGGHIVPAVFLPLMRNIQAFGKSSSKQQFDEVFRSASAFFDGVESGVIFSELLGLIDWRSDNHCNKKRQALDDLQLAQFILDNFNVREEDMLLTHVPLLVLTILVKLSELSSNTRNSEIAPDELLELSNGLMRVMNSLTTLLTERAFARKSESAKVIADNSLMDISDMDIMKRIHNFYDQSRSSLDLPPLPFLPRQLGDLITRKAHDLAASALEKSNGSIPIQEILTLLVALLKRLPKSFVFHDRRFYLAICSRLKIDQAEQSTPSFSTISSIVSAVTSLYFVQAPGYYISYEDVAGLIPTLVRHLWQFLSPASPKFHVEAVRCLWHLHSVSWSDHIVEASITSLMVGSAPGSHHLTSEEQAGRYFVLWNHSHHGSHEIPPKQAHDARKAQTAYYSSMLERPLFLVLDLLTLGPNEASQAVQRWLQDLSSIEKVFRIVILRLENLLLRKETLSENEGDNVVISTDDYKECNYLLRTIYNTLCSLSPNGWMSLLTQTLNPVDKQKDGASEDGAEFQSLHSMIFQLSSKVIIGRRRNAVSQAEEAKLQQTSLLVIRQLLQGPGGEEIAESGIDSFLVDQLSSVLDEGGSIELQGAIIDTLLSALKVRFAQAYLPPPPPRPKHQRAQSRERLTSPSLLSFTSDKADRGALPPVPPQPPSRLLECLLKGISSKSSRDIVEKWTLLLCEVLPLYSGSLFQILLIQTDGWPEDRSEHVTITLLTGLETCIAAAHERLLVEEANVPAAKSPDHAHGFFGNMVSGVFATDSNQGRSTAANNRLTVLLCFQDAVRLCFSIWSWGAVERSGPPQDPESLASFQYTSLRMRNRSRRILEHLFTAEALECLETMVEMWSRADPDTSPLILSLLHTLDGSRPKITIPAIFNAIYTRTNPAALEPHRKSALTSNLTESELAGFLVTYARSLDDDVLDEIWTDCTTFLRDVLSNPFPHRQILPRLVEFAAILGAKMENTTFGEDRRMRKDLGDVLLRLLTAIFTSKPMGLSQDSSMLGRPSLDYDNSAVPHAGPDDMLSILALSMPSFTALLGDSDRIISAVSGISSHVIGPLLRSRLFPNNINGSVMSLLQHIAKVPAAAKIWKKDIADAFNDPRFFGFQVELVRSGWMKLLRQWVIADKDRLTELMSRLPPPSTAGLMFGVGASAARLEADRKAQLNLRRISLLILSANDDYFIGELPELLQKLEDLLAATSSSSPSSTTRAEIFMVLRALALKSSTTTLAPFWPLINTELQEAISSIPLGAQQEVYNAYSLLQACKLLDTLLVLAPDDFQLLEWLYVNDTIDAVYPPEHLESMALADEISQTLGVRGSAPPHSPCEATESGDGMKRPQLTLDWIRETAKDELIDQVLRPFLDRLSINAFESTYGMGSPDLKSCQDDLLADLFNESTMAN
ncbi:Endosome to Golgi transport protein [Aspergillus fumigatus]|nr:Endosome to Golgi transport protein [Aspergillus fumigatus]KAH1872943.1 Endosome to Golgi transport protein [Aspergillus fumigatus]KAH2189789.1 Endosome to Golgi transport protein [Aspergillus fumigatus]KAH2213738.1 Endosome to Golgi transport protein [Aspergillus fumigatus]KAH2853935.1 Endosome to Golgi transport protein [Aspergillus fumigatus]